MHPTLRCLSYFFSITRPPPPPSPPFPYTTLFRSRRAHRRSGRPGQPVDDVVAGQAVSEQAASRLVRGIDRKSTRLNSSHRCISYAVFCLKKKKKTTYLKGHYASQSDTQRKIASHR